MFGNLIIYHNSLREIIFELLRTLHGILNPFDFLVLGLDHFVDHEVSLHLPLWPRKKGGRRVGPD